MARSRKVTSKPAVTLDMFLFAETLPSQRQMANAMVAVYGMNAEVGLLSYQLLGSSQPCIPIHSWRKPVNRMCFCASIMTCLCLVSLCMVASVQACLSMQAFMSRRAEMQICYYSMATLLYFPTVEFPWFIYTQVDEGTLRAAFHDTDLCSYAELRQDASQQFYKPYSAGLSTSYDDR